MSLRKKAIVSKIPVSFAAYERVKKQQHTYCYDDYLQSELHARISSNKIV